MYSFLREERRVGILETMIEQAPTDKVVCEVVGRRDCLHSRLTEGKLAGTEVREMCSGQVICERNSLGLSKRVFLTQSSRNYTLFSDTAGALGA